MTETPPQATVQRDLAALPDEVFEQWVDRDSFAEWMCPRPAAPTRIEMEPVVGGALRIDIREDGVEFYVTGVYLEVDRPHVLRFTWSCSTWDDPTVQSEVLVRLEPIEGSRTRMTITHSLLPTGLVDGHEHGWRAIADQLAGVLCE
jgi:uncharacterized protein YndB with AHSA1/START domain